MKKSRVGILVAGAAIGVAVLAGESSAQSRATAPPAAQSRQVTLRACDTEQKVAQVLQSSGAYTPQGCRNVPVTRLDSPGGAVCVLDFGSGNQGIVGEIRSAAVTTRWWVPCTDLHSP